jgi:chemotaxis protein MotB
MVTFSDLIMLLITFFVLLLTMKSMDNKSLNDMFRSVQVSRGQLELVDTGSEGDLPALVGAQKKQVVVKNPEVLRQALEAMKGVESLPEEEQAPSDLQRFVDISEDARGVVVTLETDQLFDSGSAEIVPNRLFILERTADLLRNAVNDIHIMGHTDNVSIRGGAFDSNWELSFYRALSVYFYLSDSAGLRPEKLAVGGYGDQMPRVPNDSDANRAKNRRVEFILKKQG